MGLLPAAIVGLERALHGNQYLPGRVVFIQRLPLEIRPRKGVSENLTGRSFEGRLARHLTTEEQRILNH